MIRMSDNEDAIPKHIAIIMDGNGRWAKSRGFPRWKGHEAGAESVRRVIEACIEAKVEYLTLYAFSTENWNRPKAEVTALMKLLEQFLKKHSHELQKNGVKLHAIGRINDLTEAPLRELNRTISETKDNNNLNLVLALSYGAREEIVDAVNEIINLTKEGRFDKTIMTQDSFKEHLYTSQIPDPDLLIRTSGETRLSNFMLWQSAYSEIHFTETLWPNFEEQEFLEILQSYSQSERRFGNVDEDIELKEA